MASPPGSEPATTDRGPWRTLDVVLAILVAVLFVAATGPIYVALHDIAAYEMLKRGELIGPGDSLGADFMAWCRRHLFGGTSSTTQEVAALSFFPALAVALPLLATLLGIVLLRRRRRLKAALFQAAMTLGLAVLLAGSYGFYRYVRHIEPWKFRSEVSADPPAQEHYQDPYE